MAKFQRRFSMSVQGRSGAFYTLAWPLTCVFNIDIRGGSGVNEAHFMIFNLSPAVRSDIQYDSAIDIDGKVVLKRSVVFNAGYLSEGPLPAVFQGNIKKAFFYRDGPNVITDITVMDGLDAVQKSMIAISRASGWTGALLANDLIDVMSTYGVTLGAVGSFFSAAPRGRGVTCVGSTWDALKKLAVSNGGCASINQGKVYVLGPNDALSVPGALPTISAATGLIGTPRRSGWVVDAEMFFEPNVTLWQLINLQVAINPSLNGVRRIDAISHRGTISGAKDGGVVTGLSLYSSPGKFTATVPA